MDKDYVSKLKMIKAVDCPKDFRMAWLDYVQAWERRAEAGLHGKLAAEGETVAGAAADLHGATKSGADLIDKAQTKLDGMNTAEAWRQVEKVAMAYDVAVLPLNFRKQPVDMEHFQQQAFGRYEQILVNTQTNAVH